MKKMVPRRRPPKEKAGSARIPDAVPGLVYAQSSDDQEDEGYDSSTSSEAGSVSGSVNTHSSVDPTFWKWIG